MAVIQNKSRHQLTMAASWTNGEGGIRTPGAISDTQHFQCCTISRSATSPNYPRSARPRGSCEDIILRQNGCPLREHCPAVPSGPRRTTASQHMFTF